MSRAGETLSEFLLAQLLTRFQPTEHDLFLKGSRDLSGERVVRRRFVGHIKHVSRLRRSNNIVDNYARYANRVPFVNIQPFDIT